LKEDRYGTKQFVQGKKEALTERVEQIRKEIKEEEPERENAKIAKLLVNNYMQALGPHTKSEDGRVGVFNQLLKEYTLSVIKSCMEVFAEVQVEEFNLMVKGREPDEPS
jgi:hypothetical protein